MKILTWNINGIRATKEPLGSVLAQLDADIICLQETKVTRDQLDEPSAIVEGFTSYFSFSKTKSGYSGVATFVKDSCTPVKAEEGLSGILASDHEADNVANYGNTEAFDDELQALDSEGRAIITQHLLMDGEKEQLLTIINVYCPRADPEREDRKEYKLQFYRLLQLRAEAILAGGSHVIILGDVNTSHKRIDNCDPSEDFAEHRGRHWMDQMLQENGGKSTTQNTAHGKGDDSITEEKSGHQFIDSFRYFYPDKVNAYTCWCTVSGARATNYGTRIDYILGNCDLVNEAFEDCILMPDFEGSDHCPVKATLKWKAVAANKCPPLCTKHMPEFAGKQQKLSSFFTKVKKEDVIKTVEVKLPFKLGNKTEKKIELEKKPTLPAMFMQQRSTCNNESKPSVKRLGSNVNNQNTKKLKLEDKKSSSGGAKQGNLLRFLGKTSSVTKKEDKTDSKHSAESKTFDKDADAVNEALGTSSSTNNNTPSATTSTSKTQIPKQAAVNSWKNLLKGPPPAPLCKGHSEPCLLRTVKKEESLNKGRQFWVCNRPEGHKTNPEARCEHFVWIDKKAKAK